MDDNISDIEQSDYDNSSHPQLSTDNHDNYSIASASDIDEDTVSALKAAVAKPTRPLIIPDWSKVEDKVRKKLVRPLARHNHQV